MTIYRIALCEDEKIFSETQKKICCEILEKMNIEYSITAFENGEDFFEVFSVGGQRYDLILLDIVMARMNGMELAKKIRESDMETAIVFVTSNREYAIEGYDVNAFHYLIKPVDKSALERVIARIYKDKFQSNYFVLKSGSLNQRILINDIISLETVGRKVEITLMDKTLYYSGKLTEILSGMPTGCFVRCHQAFAVNIRNIRELNRIEIIAVNGKHIPVSRSYFKDVQTMFLRNMQNF